MGGSEPPDRGGGVQSGDNLLNNQAVPKASFADVAGATSVKGGRPWHEIFADAKQNRNILEIHVSKNDDNTENIHK